MQRPGDARRVVPLVTAPRLETEAIAAMLRGEELEAWSVDGDDPPWSPSLRNAYGCAVLVTEDGLDRALELLDGANRTTPAIDLTRLEADRTRAAR